MLGQESFGIDRCHTTGSGRGYGLTIICVLGIAARKYALDIGFHRPALGNEITDVIHIEQIFE